MRALVETLNAVSFTRGSGECMGCTNSAPDATQFVAPNLRRVHASRKEAADSIGTRAKGFIHCGHVCLIVPGRDEAGGALAVKPNTAMRLVLIRKSSTQGPLRKKKKPNTNGTQNDAWRGWGNRALAVMPSNDKCLCVCVSLSLYNRVTM